MVNGVEKQIKTSMKRDKAKAIEELYGKPFDYEKPGLIEELDRLRRKEARIEEVLPKLIEEYNVLLDRLNGTNPDIAKIQADDLTAFKPFLSYGWYSLLIGSFPRPNSQRGFPPGLDIATCEP